MKRIQVGFLVSYDYNLLRNSLPRVYDGADSIFLAIDKERKTWNGENFNIEEGFFSWIKSIDINNKITIYEDNFYVSTLSTMECEVRERKMLSEKMGVGNWLIQLDTDEYFLNFDQFLVDLKKYNYLLEKNSKPVQIAAYLVNIYKYVGDGFLFVAEPTRCLTATNYPNYITGRNTRKRIIYTRNLILHETLSRSEEELSFKLKNWGHKNQINPEFLNKWKKASKENYMELKNVFFIEPEKWKSLEYVNGKTIEEVALNFNHEEFLPSKFYIMKKNFGQWFKFLFK